MRDILELLSPLFYWRLARLVAHLWAGEQFVEADIRRAREGRR